jgi:hypothetical protein
MEYQFQTVRAKSNTSRSQRKGQLARLVTERRALRSMTPNPSIEEMPKRLRLLCTPHVKR